MNLEQAIVASLVYFDIFDYPLTADEIAYWLPLPVGLARSHLARLMKELVRKRVLAQKEGFYCIFGREEIISKRKENQKLSVLKLKIAQKIAQILIKVPGVLLVGLTGNLAMMAAQKNDDIDFLIITQRGKIWTARFLMVLLLEILGRRRRPESKQIRDKICLNLFLEEAHLYFEKSKQDLYIAHEILQMRPLVERDTSRYPSGYRKENIYRRFLESNVWVRDFLPNAFIEKTRIYKQDLVIFPKKRRRKSIFTGYQSVSVWVPIEKILAFLQLWYMRKRQTTEQVEKGQFFFHPQDKRREVMEQYQKRILKFGFG